MVTLTEPAPLKISVIVPVRNESKHIQATLNQLLTQDYPSDRFEILVIDGQSTDDTPELVRQTASQHTNVHLLDNPKRLSSAARNIGVRQSTGDVVLLVDGHCEIPSQSYFTDLSAAFGRGDVDCLGRPQPLDVTGATSLQRAIALARSSRLGHHPDSFIYSSEEIDCPATSVAIAYRRSIFDQVGYFDERFDACEDCEFNYRIDQAGLRCRLVPKLSIKYQPRNSLRGLFRQLYRYGRGRVRLFRKHPAAFSLSAILPALFVAGVIIGPIVCSIVPPLWTLYAAFIAIWTIALLAESARLAIQSGDRATLRWLPIVFAAVHTGSGWGVLRETLSPR